MNPLIRLGAGIAIAVVMYLFLPVLDILEIIFILLLGMAWLLVIIDIFLTMFGMIQDRSMGLAETWRSGVETMRQRAKSVREDLARRVEQRLDEHAA